MHRRFSGFCALAVVSSSFILACSSDPGQSSGPASGGSGGAGGSAGSSTAGVSGNSGEAGSGNSGTSGTSGTAGSGTAGNAGTAGTTGGVGGSSGTGGGGTGGMGGTGGTGAIGGTGGSGALGGTGGTPGCAEGQTMPCYTGPMGTENVGACKAGVATCNGGVFGNCLGEVTPAAEICDNLDNDCNGQADDNLGEQSCGQGACLITVPNCANGTPVVCMEGEPMNEICDGIDNNCDGTPDEGNPDGGAPCMAPGVLGECVNGTETCSMGALVCEPGAPQQETCDGLDNDCDGTPDNNIPGTGTACSTGLLGECEAGSILCVGAIIDCFQNVQPSPELCDGLDNNCDGFIDDGNPESGAACVAAGALGECANGIETCTNGALECQASSPTQDLCDGLDNDCDGTADNNDPSVGQSCGCGATYACVNGQLVCQGAVTVYFSEDFKDNSKGWTLGPNWQIGPAVGGCAGCVGNPDPAQDHSASADNGIAGVVIGGPAPISTLHGFYYLESPPFDTSGAAGSVYLSFWRWLNSDYINYMQNTVEVFNGTSWVALPYGTTGGCCPGIQDSVWTNHPLPAGAPAQPTNSAQYPTQFDLTPYKNAQMRIRFGYRVGSSGAYTIGSWSLDDIVVASQICP